MKILIRQARIIDPGSPHHQQQTDIFINDGLIEKIGNQPDLSVDREITAENLFVSTGWVDLFAHLNDPGYEQKETLETGAYAAACGGYTDIFVLPNTSPCIHNKSVVEYIMQRSRSLPVNLFPLGAVTKNTEGKELAEMYDMHASGSIAFTDGVNPIQSAGITLKALQYLKAINGILIQIPRDLTIGSFGLMNEGIISTQLGLPGMPAIAEEIMIRRDIELATYAGSAIHFTGISSKESVRLIRRAKEEGVRVTCSVTPYHLCFTDEDLQQYNTNLKTVPPLRTRSDRDALREAVMDGTIDCIASHHLPEDVDHKVVEFEYARPGMIGLQTAYAIVRQCLPQLTDERIVALFSTNPRNIFKLETSIKEGVKASLTLFQPDASWTFTEADIRSKSRNTPFLGSTFRGRPYGIITKDSLFLNQ